MSTQNEWKLQVFTVEDSFRPIPVMDPSIVCVRQHASTEVHLWPPRRKMYKARVPRGNTVTKSGAAKTTTGPTTDGANQNNANDEDEDEGDMNDDMTDEELNDDELTSPNYELLERALIARAHERQEEEKQEEPSQALHVETTESRGRGSKDDVAKRLTSRAFIGCADAFVSWGQGRIAYYENKKIFQATCHKHPKCTLS
eukprot:2150823-Amphidinium_carterae.2